MPTKMRCALAPLQERNVPGRQILSNYDRCEEGFQVTTVLFRFAEELGLLEWLPLLQQPGGLGTPDLSTLCVAETTSKDKLSPPTHL